MKVLNGRIGIFTSTASLGGFLLPVSMILLGFALAFFVGGGMADGILKAALKSEIDIFFGADLGCVFIFAALVLAAMFIAAPLLIALSCFAYGYFSTASWSFIISRLSDDISVGCVITRFFLILLFTAVFIVFAQIELRFYSNAAVVFFRNKSLVSRLRRVLLSALAAILILLSVCRLFAKLFPIAL